MKTVNLVFAILCYIIAFCVVVVMTEQSASEVGGSLAAFIVWAVLGMIFNMNYTTLREYEKK
jgi:hypothetical protein